MVSFPRRRGLPPAALRMVLFAANVASPLAFSSPLLSSPRHCSVWRAASSPVPRRLAGPRMMAGPHQLDGHIDIDEEFPGIQKIHSSPNIYLVDDMLTREECDSIVEAASKKEMKVSPVAYAGWSEDAGLFSRLLPIGALPTVNSMMNAKEEPLVIAATALAIWGYLSAVFWGCAWLWAQWRTRELQQLRTSTSVTLEGDGLGDAALVRKAEKLLRSSWKTFEAPTVIHYAPGQVLAPHFDANRGAEIEDANRGGQTLATLLVYLNDVPDGGKTAFGRLGLEVEPKVGQGLLFFPADAEGEFDERVEHEGCLAKDEKWIARIWRHQKRVPPPFGLRDDYATGSKAAAAVDA